GLGNLAGAELSLQVAIIQMPGLAIAHETLADLYDKELRRPADAALHRTKAMDIRRENRSPRDQPRESAPDMESRDRPTFKAVPAGSSGDPSRDVGVASDTCGRTTSAS